MSEEDISDCIHQLEQTSSNYNKLLEDVLTWSRLQLNKIPIECQDLNVHILVKEISELYSEQVQKKKIWIHNQIPENLEIKSDKGMLQAVFRNLISNAIKFTSEGGDIWLHYRSDKAFHFIDVKDNGVGMSDAVMRTLFTNSTISMAGTNNEAGTGLGLSICKEFLSKDEAQLFVESVEGKGSIFTIALPLEETRKRLQIESKTN
jgi:signal transduction histidine kinase